MIAATALSPRQVGRLLDDGDLMEICDDDGT